MDTIDRLLEHDHWATTEVLDLSQNLTDTQLDQEFDIGHRTLRATFDHINTVIDFWTGTMTGQSLATADDDRSITALTTRYQRSQARYATFARRIRDDQRLDDTFDHDGRRKTFGSTFIHVALHSALHRGEAQHILQRLGVPEIWDYDPQEWEMNT